MLKKPSAVYSSYSNFHTLSCFQSQSAYASAPQHRPQEPISSRPRRPHRRSYAAVRPGPRQDRSNDLPWPKLPSPTAIPTPYQILRTKRGALYSKHRYYELAKMYHPDRHGHGNGQLDASSLSGAVKMERYRLVVSAHEILSDPVRRSAYDATGAGWNGRPEHGAIKYHWGQNKETRWSGFDTNDSPFQNATWEDWEKWYMRDKKKQEPVYFSNGGFLMLVITVVFLGGFGQSIRVGDYSDLFQRQVEKAHDDASKALRKRKTESIKFDNRDERLRNFLSSRDPHGYGVTDPTEEGYRKLLPEPEACLSDGINQRGKEYGVDHDSFGATSGLDVH